MTAHRYLRSGLQAPGDGDVHAESVGSLLPLSGAANVACTSWQPVPSSCTYSNVTYHVPTAGRPNYCRFIIGHCLCSSCTYSNVTYHVPTAGRPNYCRFIIGHDDDDLYEDPGEAHVQDAKAQILIVEDV